MGIGAVLLVSLLLPNLRLHQEHSAGDSEKDSVSSQLPSPPWYLSGKVLCLTLANALNSLLLAALTDWAGRLIF
jgi:hypothetical protein